MVRLWQFRLFASACWPSVNETLGDGQQLASFARPDIVLDTSPYCTYRCGIIDPNRE